MLLSSLPGAAITAARVRGVAHEFSTIPGIKEDVVQLVLNLKQIRLRSFASEPVTLTLEKTGPGEATAADIMTTSEIEIVNPEAKIATLEPEASLWLELTVETGRGFVLHGNVSHRQTPPRPAPAPTRLPTPTSACPLFLFPGS